MFEFDLMNIFEGLVRNYVKFGLNNDSSKSDIINQEVKYIISVGEVLGYSALVNNREKVSEYNKKNIEVLWRKYDDKKALPKELVLYFSIEEDLINDIKAIENLMITISNEKNTQSFMQFLEVSSKERISYINKLIQSSRFTLNKDVLLVYKIQNILEKKSYWYAYLFSENTIVKEKKASSYVDVLGILKAKFKI
ncbi:hypothetical protein JCM1393_27420 [Clostridium carnis]